MKKFVDYIHMIVIVSVKSLIFKKMLLLLLIICFDIVNAMKHILSKAIVFFIAFLFATAVLHAHGGVLSGAKGKLYVTSTKYFDIIYPLESKSSALKLAEKADEMYLEICSSFQTEPYQRFPVTITPSVESLNAYFSASPYNRIVLYDTVPEESLDMFSDTLLDVFYHELTHAVTMNIKSPVMKKLSFFSDAATLQGMSFTPFWIEGAAVFMESKDDEGRLNDAYSLQMAYQAKEENKRLSWRDVTGGRDTFPGGSDAYIFGSLFAEYLSDKYGREKYNEFWKVAGEKLPLSLVAGIFKEVYGVKLSDEWKGFWKILESPKIDIEKTKLAVSDFEGEKKGIKRRITAIDEKDGVLVFADAFRNGVFLSRYDEKNGKYTKAKKILSISAVTELCIASDKKSVNIIHNTTRATTKKESVLFDLNRFRVVKKRLCGNEIASRVLDDGSVIFSERSPVVISGKSYVPYLKKDKMQWRLCLKSLENGLESEFLLGEGVIAHSLHVAKNEENKVFLTFSFVLQGKSLMYPRSAIAVVNEIDGSLSAAAYFQAEDVSGGADTPVADITFSEENPVLICKANYFEKSYLYRLDFSKLESTFVSLPLYSDVKSEENEMKSEENEVKIEEPKVVFEEKRFHKIPSYFARRTFVPLSTLTVWDREMEESESAILGLTYSSSVPWGNNLLALSGGYNVASDNGGVMMSLSGGNEAFSYTLSGTAVFDEKGFMQTADTLESALLIHKWLISSLTLGTKDSYLFGHDSENNLFDTHYGDGNLFLNFSTIHKVSPRYEMKSGFSLKPFVSAELFALADDLDINKNYVNAGATLLIRLPFIMPVSLSATLFPKCDQFASSSALIYLFSLEIQKGIPAASLFLNRITLTAEYDSMLKYESEQYFDIKRADEIARNITFDDYYDKISACLHFILTLNTSVATGHAYFDIAAGGFYSPRAERDKKKSGALLTAKISM